MSYHLKAGGIEPSDKWQSPGDGPTARWSIGRPLGWKARHRTVNPHCSTLVNGYPQPEMRSCCDGGGIPVQRGPGQSCRDQLVGRLSVIQLSVVGCRSCPDMLSEAEASSGIRCRCLCRTCEVLLLLSKTLRVSVCRLSVVGLSVGGFHNPLRTLRTHWDLFRKPGTIHAFIDADRRRSSSLRISGPGVCVQA